MGAVERTTDLTPPDTPDIRLICEQIQKTRILELFNFPFFIEVACANFWLKVYEVTFFMLEEFGTKTTSIICNYNPILGGFNEVTFCLKMPRSPTFWHFYVFSLTLGYFTEYSQKSSKNPISDHFRVKRHFNEHF